MITQDDIYCGSALAVTPEYITEFINTLYSACDSAKALHPRNLTDIHNNYCAYTLCMLLFASGHRSVSDPFYDINLFDLKLQSVIVEDKFVSSVHQARLAWLPDIAVTQIKHYLDHLTELSWELREKSPTLSKQIWRVTQTGFAREMPLFFFLDDTQDEWQRITPSQLERHLGSSWILPLNSNRHVMATWLQTASCPSELIDAQLGHIEAGCEPYGSFSVRTPQEDGQTLVPFLNTIFSEQGWRPKEGLVGRARQKWPQQVDGSPEKEIPLGPVLREEARIARWKKESELVDKIVNDFLGSNQVEIWSKDKLDQLMDRVFDHGAGGKYAKVRLALLRRKLLKMRRSGIELEIPGAMAMPRIEPSPFSGQSHLHSTTFEKLRTTFISYLANQDGRRFDTGLRLAEISLSSVLFGGLLDQVMQEQLPARIADDFYVCDKFAMVDLAYFPGHPNSPQRRWFPDEVTLALITGLQQKKAGTPIEANGDKISYHLRELLRRFHLTDVQPQKRLMKTGAKIAPALLPLTELAKDYWGLRLPAVLRAYSEGRVMSASVPPANLQRLVTGVRVGPSPATQDIVAEPTANLLEDPITPPSDGILEYATINTYGFSKELSQALSQAALKTKRPAEGRAELEARLVALYRKWSELSLMPIAYLLCSWLIHLCRHGTAFKAKLSPRTISGYGRTISSLLVEQAKHLDILSLSDAEFEDIYRRVVEISLRANKEYVQGRLKEFHTYLSRMYGAPSIDWQEVFDGETPANVDAALISVVEFDRAFTLLLDDAYSSARERCMHAMVLVLGYRFGLRVGEIFRVTGGDLLREGEEVIVYVRNSTYGFTKSDNGVRQIPLIGLLPQREYDVIDRWLTHIESYAESYELAALLSPRGQERVLLDRGRVVARCVEALRLATGDENIRLRHLRHSFASRNFLYGFCSQIPSGQLGHIYRAMAGEEQPSNVREKLLGSPLISYRAIYANAVAQGHGGPRVTLESYTHLLDIALLAYTGRHAMKVSYRALAYALQTSGDNVRQIRRRKGADGDEHSWLAFHFLDRMHSLKRSDQFVEETKPLALGPKQSQQDESKIGPADIDRLLSLASLKGNAIGLAERFFIPDHIVQKLLISASHLQEEVHYLDFGLPELSRGDSWFPFSAERQEHIRRRSVSVRETLKELSIGSDQRRAIQAIGDIWKRSFSTRTKMLLLNRRSELKKFIDAASTLGLPPHCFDVVVPKDKDGIIAPWDEALPDLLSVGVNVRGSSRIPLGKAGNPSNRVGVILSNRKVNPVRYQQTLNRIIFILLCWLHIEKTLFSASAQEGDEQQAESS